METQSILIHLQIMWTLLRFKQRRSIFYRSQKNLYFLDIHVYAYCTVNIGIASSLIVTDPLLIIICLPTLLMVSYALCIMHNGLLLLVSFCG